MPVQVPDGNPIPPATAPEDSAKLEWASMISDKFKHEDENILCDCLAKYRDAGHPEFRVRNWLTILEGLENVPDRTPKWRRERADLLLEYLERQQKLEILHGAIEQIEAKDGNRFKMPVEDKKMYFVVNQLIQGDPELAFHLMSRRQPVFMIAASQGAVYIVQLALEKLRSRLNEKFAKSKEKVNENLFSYLRVLDDALNTALGLAVEQGHAEIVHILLDAEKRLAGPDYLSIESITIAVQKCEIDIINMVLDARPDIAERLPELIVQYKGPRYQEMWTAMAPRFEKLLQDSDILHLAVQNEKLDIIDWLVRRFPQMVTRKNIEGKIALYHNTNPKIKEAIRESIVPEIVRQRNPIQMKELLRVANDSPRQASLDLRVFNQGTHDFSHFVKLVEADIRTRSGLNAKPASTSNIKFESVLRYVHFPDLSLGNSSEEQKTDRQEAPLILDWLRRKGVKSIMRLIVPDCRANPLDEDKIRNCLEHFGVEDLNWRRLDLGIEPIMSLESTLAVLHLYSSGSWAVLSHWVSEGGLERLKKLRELHITIVEESMTLIQAERYKDRTIDQINHLKSRRGWAWLPVVKIQKWSHGTKLMQKVEGVTSVADPEEKSASSCVKLDAFLGEYTNIQQARLEKTTTNGLKPSRKIKIALIDTGIGAMGDRNQLQIKDGISFGHGADGESESPWWIPSNEHGPQMADIICSIDPYCEVYPVKITDDTDEGAVNGPPIIDAIKWAIEQGVDIISLSLVLYHSHEELYKAVQTASQKNIVIICSTADRGNNQQRVYPAQYWKEKKTDCLIPIAGCDQYGKLTDWSTETKAKYHFLGKDVTAKSVGLIRNSSKKISGSSVATALAAGTASLVLSCSLLASEDENYTRKQRIEIFFEKMQTEETQRHSLKYVEPAIIFGEDSIAGADLEKYIKRTFS